MDTWRPEFLCDSFTSDSLISKKVAISFAEGARSSSCSIEAYALFILFIEPILFKGNRTIRDCSAKACKID